MMKKSQLRVSLIIPAYNEESHLALCLDAVAAQTVRPFEVIVVDNNSTDATAAIARRYPFVRLVREARRGVVYARDAGFDAARGDIIGRIDVDSVLPPDWTATVQHLFADTSLDAVSGTVTYYDMPWRGFFGWCNLLFRGYLARRMAGQLFLYGSNMAIRRQAWQAVRGELCHQRAQHEDFDLAAHLAQAGSFTVRYDARLRAQVSGRLVNMDFFTFYTYLWSCPRVYAAHDLRKGRHMYVITTVFLVLWLPLHLLYRSYDAKQSRFSLRYLFRPDYAPHASPVAE
jgi:glycosyltransferase involved in cell wall biosynthesis